MFHQHFSRLFRATLLVVFITLICLPSPVISQATDSRAQSAANASAACTFFDDFTDNDTGWLTNSGTEVSINIADGEYKWQLNRGEDLGRVLGTGAPGTECTNFHLEVDTSVISTGYSSYKTNLYRLKFGDQYTFDIYYDSTFALTDSNGAVILRSGVLPASFNAPPATNRLFVNVFNRQIVVGANGVPYAFYTDPGFTSGLQGVGVGVYSDVTHEVHFDNFSQIPGSRYPLNYNFLPAITK